jgi:hypothetical protein
VNYYNVTVERETAPYTGPLSAGPPPPHLYHGAVSPFQVPEQSPRRGRWIGTALPPADGAYVHAQPVGEDALTPPQTFPERQDFLPLTHYSPFCLLWLRR